MHSSRGVLTKLQRALEGRTPLQLSAPKEAAVTLVIRQVRNEPELLFIKRTERETDNWSGHVAVPGGKVDEGESGREAAEREAMEECGLRLDDPSSFQFMGRLDDRSVFARGKRLQMKMSPFVYRHIGDREIVITPEAGEVQAYRWVPLKFFETANVEWDAIQISTLSFFPKWMRRTATGRAILQWAGMDHAYCPSVLLPPHEVDDPYPHVEFRLWGLTMRLTSDLLYELQWRNASLISWPTAQFSSPFANMLLNLRWGVEELLSYPRFGLHPRRGGFLLVLSVAMLACILASLKALLSHLAYE